MNTTNIKFDLLFIDDNSNDGSQEIIKNLLKRNQNINCIFRPKKMGIGSAHKDGLIWSYKKKYKTIITMDADGTHDPKYLQYLIDELKIFDIVVTTRFLGKNSLADKIKRRYGSFLSSSTNFANCLILFFTNPYLLLSHHIQYFQHHLYIHLIQVLQFFSSSKDNLFQTLIVSS